jgi:hypothetical protein
MFIYEKPKFEQNSFPLLRYLMPRLPDLLFVVLLAGVIGLGSRMLNMDGDLGRHLTIGNYILTSGGIPRSDLFSHSLAGQPLTPHEWLAQVVFAFAYRIGGLDGVVLFSGILIAATFSLVYWECARRGRSPLLALGLAILAAATASLHWLTRPHLFTLLLLVLWTAELERVREGFPPRIWAFPALMLSWANLHGAFIAGFVIWGIYLTGELLEWFTGSVGRNSTLTKPKEDRRKSRVRVLLIAGSASFLASLLNPAGWGLWKTSLGYLGSRYLVGHTAEYLPPDFHSPEAWPFLIMIGLSIMIFGSGRVRLAAAPVLVVALWTVMGLYSARNVPLYAALSAPVLAEAAGAWLRKAEVLGRVRRLDHLLSAVEESLRGHLWPAAAICLATLAFAAGARLDFARQGNVFDPQVFPVEAVDWMESQALPEKGFNYFTWGGYLLFREWPEQRVFIDGQTDFYGEALTRKYEQVISLREGWEEVLEEYGIGWVLIPPGSPLAKALVEEPRWQEVYHDGTASVFFISP